MLEILRQNADGNVELEALPVDLGDVSDTDGLRLDRRGRISSQTKHKSPMDSIHEVCCQVGCFTVASIRTCFIFSRFAAISLSLSPIFPLIFLCKTHAKDGFPCFAVGRPCKSGPKIQLCFSFLVHVYSAKQHCQTDLIQWASMGYHSEVLVEAITEADAGVKRDCRGAG